MPAVSRSPLSADWRDIASLGEQIVNAASLAEQRDRIIAITSHLVKGEVDVWLNEKIFRLPGPEERILFPEEPELQGMQRAVKAGKVRARPQRGQNSPSRATWAAVPLIEQGEILGALQVTRKNGPEFKQRELDLLERLAGAVSVSLVVSHRVAVEHFRLNQLNLVREVSAQIANVLDLNELATRVTELIQRTFHYYYVAIFTVKEGSTSLRFHSSAMPKGSDLLQQAEAAPVETPHNVKPQEAVEVEIGQGLVGQAA